MPSRGFQTLIAATPIALPLLLALVVFLVLAGSDGGFAPGTWYPAALFLAGLLVAALASVPRREALPRLTTVAVVSLGAFACWSYLSIAWADQQGDAWDGANRAALCALVFALFALWPVRAPAAAVLVGAFGLAVAGIGVLELLRAAASATPETYFIGGRLAEPVGYPNGNVALWFCAFWPCVALAARREVQPLLRGALLGAAVVLGALALMGQSRGWLFATPVAVLVFLLITPQRSRAGLTLLVAAAAIFAVRSPATGVYNALLNNEAIAPALTDSARAILLVAVAVGVVGAAIGYLDRTFQIAPDGARLGGIALLAAAMIVCVVGFGVWVAREGNPVTTVSEKWEEFKTTPTPTSRSSRFSAGLGSYRYDFWRVAVGNLRRSPLIGVGAENFQQDYLARRRGPEEPVHPHSFELRVLSQTGIVGALLMIVGLGSAAAMALRAARGSDLGAAAAAGATMVFAYWLIHGSVDWFFEFPGLAAPAFAMLGLAGALAWPAGDGLRRPARVVVRGRLAIAAVALAFCALVTSFGLPWLADRDTNRAATGWPTRPDEAFDRLERAARLNPLSSRPQLVGASIALRVGRLDLAEREFRAALRRDPRNAYAALELGAIASQRGQRRLARKLLARAVRLNPRDQLSVAALADVRAGKRVDIDRLNTAILEQARQRIR